MLVQRRNFTSRGCLACIDRKIKCDQRKPSCGRCGRIGIHCPGYRHTDDLYFRNSLSLVRSSDSNIRAGKSTPPIVQKYNGCNMLELCSMGRPSVALNVQDISPCGHEAESLYHFRTLAAHDFQGYLRSEFWSSTIYQRSLLSPAIRHALLAVSDAHREWVVNSSASLSPATLSQYGKALRITMAGVQAEKTCQTYIVSLCCCILLYYFELLNRNFVAAGVHLENGLHLLQEWHSTSPEWPPAELNGTSRAEFFQLLYTIGRLDVEWSISGVMRKDSPQTYQLLRDGLRPILQRPTDAFSLGCRLLLVSWSTLHFTKSNCQLLGTCETEVPQDVLLNQHLLYRRLDAILAMLDECQVQVDQTSMSGRQRLMTICIMRLYLISNRVRLAGMFTADAGEIAKPYDEYADNMLEYADMAANLRCEPPLRQGFLPEPGIIGPLRRLANEVSHEGLRCRAQIIIDRLSNINNTNSSSLGAG